MCFYVCRLVGFCSLMKRKRRRKVFVKIWGLKGLLSILLGGIFGVNIISLFEMVKCVVIM